MRKWATISLFLCFIFINFNLAYGGSAEAYVDEAKYKDLKRLMILVGAENTGMQMLSQIIIYYKNSMPNVPEKIWQNYIDKANSKMDELEEMIIIIYNKYFTHKEIKDLIKFWESPIGRKLFSVQPKILSDSMQAGQIWGEKINEELEKELKEKGYKKET